LEQSRATRNEQLELGKKEGMASKGTKANSKKSEKQTRMTGTTMTLDSIR